MDGINNKVPIKFRHTTDRENNNFILSNKFEYVLILNDLDEMTF